MIKHIFDKFTDGAAEGIAIYLMLYIFGILFGHPITITFGP